MLAEKAINGLLTLAAKGENIDAQNVRYILKLVREGKETKIGELAGDVICITAKGKPIKPKTLGQKAYCDAIAKNTITLGIGPAGTGKTYLAVAAAVAAFRAEEVNRILSQFGPIIRGRIGVPDRDSGLAVIGLIVEGTNEQVGAMTGRLGNLGGVTVKSALTAKKTKG